MARPAGDDRFSDDEQSGTPGARRSESSPDSSPAHSQADSQAHSQARSQGGSSRRGGGSDASSGEPWPAGERRRGGPDRRAKSNALAGSGLDRRRGPGRRLSDYTRAAEEGELTTEQFLFVMAIEGFKRANGIGYPSWTDVLEIVRLLGYRKTLPSEIKLRNAEDWTEAADAPAAVRPPRRDAA